jgi:signal transduction histidine kinase
MHTNISRYFLRLLTITVLLSVTLIGSLWLWDTYTVYHRDIAEIHASYMQQQHILLKNEVKHALEYIAFMRSRMQKNTKNQTEEQIKSDILAWLQYYRWGREKKNYIFVGQWDGLSLSGPGKGKNMLSITDPNGVHIVQELITQARKGGGFVKYVMPKFKNTRPAPKLSYAAPIREWKWYVGSGLYVDDVETMISARRKQLKKEFFYHLVRTGLLLLLLSVTGLIMVSLVARRIRSNLAPFSNFFHRAATDLVQIKEDALDFDEFRLLAQDANAMLQERDRILEILRNQEQLLNALTRAGHQLLSGADPNRAVTDALAILGEACEMERVYLFEVEHRNIKLRYEWTDGVHSRMKDPRFQHIPETLLKSQWADELREGRAVQGGPDDFSGVAAELTREYGVKTILMLPVLYRGKFWGMLGFDACKAPVRWAENSIHSLQNFASILCTAIMQRRSEQEATRIRDQWVMIFNSIEDAIFLLDADSKVVNANRMALQAVHVDDLASLIGLHLPEILHGEGIKFKACLADLVLQQGIPMADEVRSSVLDKIFQVSAFPVHRNDGKLTGVIYIARDMTWEKSMERQLAQARKMEAIGTLAGGIAHDFNNILAAIIGFSELARIKLRQHETDAIDSDLEQILLAGGRAKDLVSQLLIFSRNQESRKILTRVSPIIKETTKMLQAFIPANITIKTNLAPESKKVSADGTALHQVFMNLGSNAAQAMKKNGGELHIALEEIQLSPEQRDRIDNPAEQYLHIIISDQGGGIDPLFVDKIYDPFFTTKEVGEGTGMGLAAVHGIIKEHGGFIELENKPGAGAVFHIFLPQTDEETTGTLSMVNEQTTKSHTFKKVLVVDDEKMLLAMYTDMFAFLGCTTLTTDNPKKAVELLKDNPDIDLLCTDYDMPDMNGLQLAEQCHQIRPNLPIILNSGLTVDLDHDSIQHSGISEIITKPVALQELQRVLVGLVNKINT